MKIDFSLTPFSARSVTNVNFIFTNLDDDFVFFLILYIFYSCQTITFVELISENVLNEAKQNS